MGGKSTSDPAPVAIWLTSRTPSSATHALICFRLPWYHAAAPYTLELACRASDPAPREAHLNVVVSDDEQTDCYFIFAFFQPLHQGNMNRMGRAEYLGEATALLQRTFHPDKGGNSDTMVVVTECVRAAQQAAQCDKWGLLVDAYCRRVVLPDAPRPGQSPIMYRKERLRVRELFLDSRTA
jgi:hypothetical protein